MIFTAAWHGGERLVLDGVCLIHPIVGAACLSAASTGPVSQPCVSRSSHAGRVAPLYPSYILCIESEVEVVRGKKPSAVLLEAFSRHTMAVAKNRLQKMISS